MPKFRAWDKESKLWCSYNTVCREQTGDYVVEFLSVSRFAWYTNDEINDNFVLVQFTGIKDKNGVEIYDGYIVRVTDDDGRTDFSDGGIGTVCGLENLGMWYIDGQVQNALFDINQCYYIEVIGNIYENPELLGVAE